MAFDKKQYWENRKKGLRGQGEPPVKVVEAGTPGKHFVQLRPGQMAQRVNRATYRRHTTKAEREEDKAYTRDA